MTALVRFEARGDDATPSRALVCTVWPVVEQEEMETPVVARRAIVAAGGTSGGQSEIELPGPGTYLVDVAYTNGRHTRRTINVEADKPYRFVLQDRRYPSQSSRAVDTPRTRVFSASTTSPNELEVRRLTLPSTLGIDRLGVELATAILQPRRRNAAVLFASATPGEMQVIALPPEPQANLTMLQNRSWLVASCAGEFPVMVAYPDQWVPAEAPQAFRLVARRKDTQGIASKKWSVSLELLDPTYGALIEYLTRRDLQSGETVSGSMQAQAVQALYEKMENPVAAAAGAYLMALGDLTSDRRNWMQNLYRRFEWLPDGAIAWGWRLLREGESGTDAWLEARHALMDACSRGLPYYTVGLHILVDALTALSMSDKKDAEVRRMLAVAMVADSACVRSEPFTTMQVSRFQEMSTVK